MRVAVNTLLMLLLVALIVLHFVTPADASKRNFEFLPGMVDSVPYDTFAANPNFPDGKTLRPVPRGTVIRGMMPLHYGATPADALRAGMELASPVSGDRKAAARGEFVYRTWCETCHGPAGLGDGRVAQRGFPAPPSLLTPKAIGMRDGQLFHVVTYGQGNMPSYAAQIDRADRWAVIEFVRSLQAAKTGSRT